MVRSNKKTIRDLSRETPTDEDVDAIQDSLGSGPHLVTAILGQALVEIYLEDILRRRFKNRDDTTWGRMTGENGPLGSFAQKIIMGHAFGIYLDNTRSNMNIIKDIRNAFAHSKKIVSFDNELIGAEIRKFQIPRRNKIVVESYAEATNEERFIIICLDTTLEISKLKTKNLKSSVRYHRKKLLELRKIIASRLFPHSNNQAALALLLEHYQTAYPTPRREGLGALMPPYQEIDLHHRKDK